VIKKTNLLFVFLFSCLSSQAYASVGSVGFGRTAAALDATTAYYNPAGMAFLQSSEVLGGGEVVKHHSARAGDRCSLSVTPKIHWSHKISPKCAVGLSLTNLFYERRKLSTLYFDDKTSCFKSTRRECDFTPAFAAKVWKGLYVGVGCNISYRDHWERWYRNAKRDLSCRANNWSAAIVMGALYRLNKRMRVGATVKFHDTPYLRLDSKLHSNRLYKFFSRFPSVDLGFYYRIFKNWELLFDAGASFLDKLDHVSALRLDFGVRYAATKKLFLHVGAGAEGSVYYYRHCGLESPSARVAAGFDYEFSKRSVVSCTYTFLDKGGWQQHNVGASWRYRY